MAEFTFSCPPMQMLLIAEPVLKNADAGVNFVTIAAAEIK